MTDDATNETGDLPTGYMLSAMNPVYRETPWVTVDRLRAAEPVHHDRQLGRYFVTGGREVERLVKDRDLVVDPARANEGTFTKTLYGANSKELSLLMLDDPDHARQRRLVLKAFNKRSVDALMPRIEAIARDLADDIAAEDGAFDFVALFGSPLPTTVMAELLGIDAADRKDFRRWSLGCMQALNPFRTAEQTELYEQGTATLAEYLTREVEKRRGGDGDDLISGLARAEEQGDTLTTTDIVLLIRLLLIAGNSTTTDMIGSGVVKLLQNPDQLAKLKGDPGLIDNALNEVLRVEPPVAQCLRTAPQDMEVNGQCIAKGETIHLSLFGAHYDPALNADPQRFDIGREEVTHFAFGGGAHYCLGAQLGLAQGRIVLPMLFDRFPDLAFSPDHPLAHKVAPAFNGYGEIWLQK